MLLGRFVTYQHQGWKFYGKICAVTQVGDFIIEVRHSDGEIGWFLVSAQDVFLGEHTELLKAERS